MHDEDFCFRRLTITGCVSRMVLSEADSVCGVVNVWSLVLHITIKRDPRPAKSFCASGEFFAEQQISLARRVKQGSVIKAIGCLNDNGGFDLEQLLEVTS